MSDLNTVALSGRLTRDPELRVLPSGTAVTEFGLAVNRSRKTDEGWDEEVSFFEVSLFAGRAETAAKKLAKGSKVALSGALEQQRWENSEGENRSKVVVIARHIEGEDFFKPQSENRDLTANTDGEGDVDPLALTQTDEIPF